jgi:hypothetical protein
LECPFLNFFLNVICKVLKVNPINIEFYIQ